jgi:hypothetical protein
MAVAHALVVSGWHMLSQNELYREPAVAELNPEQKTRLAQRMLKRLNKLGYEVMVNRQPPAETVLAPA